MKGSRVALIVISLYNIINSLVILFYYTKSLLFTESTWSEFITEIIIFGLFSVVLISNLIIIFSKQRISSYLLFNQAVIFLQIIHLKILGFIFDFSAGMEIIPSIIINEGLTVELKYDIWYMVFTILYNNSLEGFVLGINIVSLFIWLIYFKLNRSVKDNERENTIVAMPIDKSLRA